MLQGVRAPVLLKEQVLKGRELVVRCARSSPAYIRIVRAVSGLSGVSGLSSFGQSYRGYRFLLFFLVPSIIF